MKWVALITWVLTAGGGFVLLGIWLQRGGLALAREGGNRIRPPLLFSHFGLAATGLVLWIIYLATDSDALAWIAFAVLVPVAVLGWTMFAIWYQRRRAPAPAPAAAGGTGGAVSPAGTEGRMPPEQQFPVAVVTLHGVLAVTTVVLVFLTAIGVGGS